MKKTDLMKIVENLGVLEVDKELLNQHYKELTDVEFYKGSIGNVTIIASNDMKAKSLITISSACNEIIQGSSVALTSADLKPSEINAIIDSFEFPKYAENNEFIVGTSIKNIDSDTVATMCAQLIEFGLMVDTIFVDGFSFKTPENLVSVKKSLMKLHELNKRILISINLSAE